LRSQDVARVGQYQDIAPPQHRARRASLGPDALPLPSTGQSYAPAAVAQVGSAGVAKFAALA
jgi:hypothetical protein